MGERYLFLDPLVCSFIFYTKVLNKILSPKMQHRSYVILNCWPYLPWVFYDCWYILLNLRGTKVHVLTRSHDRRLIWEALMKARTYSIKPNTASPLNANTPWECLSYFKVPLNLRPPESHVCSVQSCRCFFPALVFSCRASGHESMEKVGKNLCLMLLSSFIW